MDKCKQIIGYRYYPGTQSEHGYYRAGLQVKRFTVKNLPAEIANVMQHTTGMTADTQAWYQKRLDAIRSASDSCDGVYLEEDFEHETLEFIWQANARDISSDRLNRDPEWYGARIESMPMRTWAVKLVTKLVKHCVANNIDRSCLTPVDVLHALGNVEPVKLTGSSSDWVAIGIDALEYSARQLTHVHAESPVDDAQKASAA